MLKEPGILSELVIATDKFRTTSPVTVAAAAAPVVEAAAAPIPAVVAPSETLPPTPTSEETHEAGDTPTLSSVESFNDG